MKKEDSKITVGPEQVQKTCKDIKNDPWSYLHSFRIRSPGLLVIFLGKSIFSIPFRMNVYIIIWSEPVKGGLQEQSDQICFNTQNKSSTCICIKKCLPQHRVYDEHENLRWRKPSCEKFKDQDSKSPEIHTETVTFIENDLRCNILWSPTERPCLLATLELLSKAKIHLRKDPCNQYGCTEFTEWGLLT